MFKLAHISDVHLGPLPKVSLRQLLSKRITGYVNWHRNRRKHLFGPTLETIMEGIEAHAPDHLVVTGDLVNLATPIEIAAAAAWLETAGLPKDVSVVPGNHDAYVPGALGAASRAWHDYMRGDKDDVTFQPEDKQFPWMRVRGNVAIIGCSSAVATPPFAASGYFSARQARATANLLAEAGKRGLFRVVLIHHPPIRGAATWYKRLVGIRRFAACVSLGGAELVLHGHTHLNTLYWIDPKHGPKIPVVGIASASQGPGHHKPIAAFNLFSIEGEPGNWNLKRERYDYNPTAGVTELTQTDVLVG